VNGRAASWPRVAAILLAALLLRALAAEWTPLPAQDGVSYLWMAQRFAAGDFAAPLGEVFPPLFPLLVAPWLALGAEPLIAAQLVLAFGGTLAVVACARLAGGGQLRDDALLLAATLGLPIRWCGEVYPEPLFLLASAAALDAGLRGAPWRAGLWSGCAFGLRPEGLAIPLALVWARRGAWPACVPAALAVALLAAARGLAGHGFDPLPKLAFHAEKLALGDGGDPALLPRLLDNSRLLPAAWLEAFQLVGLLALAGLWLATGARGRALRATLLLGLGAILTFVVRRRFLSAWSAPVLALAYAALERVPPRARDWLVVACLAIGIWTGLRPTGADKLAEREVGEWLATQLAADEAIVSDLPRVVWFAGRRPPPPRHPTAAELAAAARDPKVRFVVLGARRETAREVADGLVGFTPVDPPFPAERLLILRR
jgi:hypothetical protein